VGPKAEELRRFLRLPALAGERLRLLWRAGPVTSWSGARAEWLAIESAEAVASTRNRIWNTSLNRPASSACKGLYVGAGPDGWRSSACFLAAGRPS